MSQSIVLLRAASNPAIGPNLQPAVDHSVNGVAAAPTAAYDLDPGVAACATVGDVIIKTLGTAKTLTTVLGA